MHALSVVARPPGPPGIRFSIPSNCHPTCPQHMMTIPDFEEGVRARLVEKDNCPVWVPSTLEGVSAPAVEALFAGIGEQELVV